MKRETRLLKFQHTAARRRLAYHPLIKQHRRLFQHTAARRRLQDLKILYNTNHCFNTQPPEGGWLAGGLFRAASECVSTHSRPKAAEPLMPFFCW